MMHIYNEPNGHDLKIIFSKNLTDMLRRAFANDHDGHDAKNLLQ